MQNHNHGHAARNHIQSIQEPACQAQPSQAPAAGTAPQMARPALSNPVPADPNAGGAAVVEFSLQAPGKYALVDHSLSRVERELAGYLMVDGPDNPDVFYPVETPVNKH